MTTKHSSTPWEVAIEGERMTTAEAQRITNAIAVRCSALPRAMLCGGSK